MSGGGGICPGADTGHSEIGGGESVTSRRSRNNLGGAGVSPLLQKM